MKIKTGHLHSLILYPKPASNILTIEVNNKIIGNEIEIYNFSGNLISKILIEKENFMKHEIDMSKHSTGFYRLVYKNGNTIIDQIPFIIQNR